MPHLCTMYTPSVPTPSFHKFGPCCLQRLAIHSTELLTSFFVYVPLPLLSRPVLIPQTEDAPLVPTHYLSCHRLDWPQKPSKGPVTVAISVSNIWQLCGFCPQIHHTRGGKPAARHVFFHLTLPLFHLPTTLNDQQ